MEGLALSEPKEETPHRARARDIGTPATLGSFVSTNQEKDLYYLHPALL